MKYKALIFTLCLFSFSLSYSVHAELRLVGTVPATYYNQAWEQSQITKIDVLINESGECFFAGGPGLLEMTVMVSTNTCIEIIKGVDRAFDWAITAKTNKLCCRKPLFKPSKTKTNWSSLKNQFNKEEQGELLLEIEKILLRGVLESFDFRSINDGQDWMIVVELLQYTSFGPDIKESILLTIEPDNVRRLQNILGQLSNECQKLQQDIKGKELLKY